MSVHITARVAWHDDGWNGHICRKPSANTYCVGPRSYPGQLIAELRSLEWEETVCGQSTGNLDRIPPCCYSMNAFGADEIPAESAPPVWFGSGAQTRRWTLPPATVCVWPYEEMYADEVSTPQGSFDYKKRLDRALEFFSRIQPDKSLIF
ncbi:MAG TPA: exonuclease, partial [Spirochaetia bacterium]|nr:exonuclease [Spirochaetia bacterium]